MPTLCRLFGISDRELRDHAAAGRIVRVGRGRYDLGASVLGYCKHLREMAARLKSASGLDTTHENAMLTRERRAALHKSEQKDAGNLIPVELVIAVMVDHAKGIKGMILGISNEVQSELPHLEVSDLLTIKGICEKVLRDNALRIIDVDSLHPEIQQYIDEKRGKKAI